MKRGQKEGFFAPDKFDNHTTDAEKKKERSRKKKGVEEKKKKKTVVTLLGFILASLEIIFVRNREVGIGAFQILIG